jgi:hypothetical protein
MPNRVKAASVADVVARLVPVNPLPKLLRWALHVKCLRTGPDSVDRERFRYRARTWPAAREHWCRADRSAMAPRSHAAANEAGGAAESFR